MTRYSTSRILLACLITTGACGPGDDSDAAPIAQPVPVGASFGPVPSAAPAATASPWQVPTFPFTESTPDELRVMAAALPSTLNGERLLVDPLGGFAVVGLSADAMGTPTGLDVSRYDQATAPLWARTHRCDGAFSPRFSALMTSTGTTLITGGFSGSCNFGLEDARSTVNPGTEEPWPEVSGSEFDAVRGAPSTDWFTLALDESGHVASQTLITGAGEQFASAMYADNEGAAVLFGQFEGVVEVLGEQFVNSSGAAETETLIVDFDEASELASPRQLALSGVLLADALPGGDAVLAGVGRLPPREDEGDSESTTGWVLAVSDEQISWALEWQPALAPTDLEVDADGNTYLVLPGQAPEFEPDPSSPVAPDPALAGVLLVKLSPRGKILWQRRASGKVMEASLALKDGQVAVFGTYSEQLRFGEEVFSGAPGGSAFAWFVDADGEAEYALAVASSLNGRGLDIVANPAGGWMSLWWSSDFYPGLSSSLGYHALWFRDGD